MNLQTLISASLLENAKILVRSRGGEFILRCAISSCSFILCFLNLVQVKRKCFSSSTSLLSHCLHILSSGGVGLGRWYRPISISKLWHESLKGAIHFTRCGQVVGGITV